MSQRVVGGELSGRRLASLPRGIDGLRPTSARVRSAIFDRLQHEVRGARVLDLFAGSGALSVEALSRGAAHATLVESHPKIARFVGSQLADLGLHDRCELVQRDALRFLAGPPGGAGFDLVLLDPPWAQPELYERVLGALSPWLGPKAIVVCEADKRIDLGPSDGERGPGGIFEVEASKIHGDTRLEFLILRG